MYIHLPESARARMTGGKPWGKAGAANPKQNDPSNYRDQIQRPGTITHSEQTTLTSSD